MSGGSKLLSVALHFIQRSRLQGRGRMLTSCANTWSTVLTSEIMADSLSCLFT